MAENDLKVVNKEVCEQCRSNINNLIYSLRDKEENNSEAISELRQISASQVEVLKQVNSLVERILAKQDKLEERMNEIDRKRLEEENLRLQNELRAIKEQNTKDKSSVKKVWEQKWFIIVIIVISVIVLGVFSSAIGMNLFEEMAHVNP